jgi:lipopolysaccharide transport system permease protein
MTIGEPIRFLFARRGILFATVRQGLRQRTAGRVLGTLWLLLYPLLFLAMYSAVFVHILQVRMPDLATSDYVITIFCGLVPFLAFADALGTGTQSIVGSAGLVRNTLFPIELVPAKEVLVSHLSMGIGLLLVWLSVLFFGHVHWTHLLVPVAYLLQITMTLGLVWIVATLNVFFKDLSNVVPILVLFLMLISPIAYTADMVPARLKPLLMVNPLALFMDLYRNLLLHGVIPWGELALAVVVSFALFWIGFRTVSRLSHMFIDYV